VTIPPVIACVGVHILDILGRPVTDIPPGQGGLRIEEIRLTAAGTAAGTAVDLAKLGAHVRAVGCIGQDEMGDFLLALLHRQGVDTAGLVRTSDAQTSATILPIRPNGDRPAFHVVGANSRFDVAALDWSIIESADHVHLGGVDAMGAFAGTGAQSVLQRARGAGVTTSLDLLGARPSARREEMCALFALVDHLLPNEEQLADLFPGCGPLEAARQALARGAGCVVVSLGADGCLVVDSEGHRHLSARSVTVVDTTGCGDALSAGYLRGLTLGRAPVDAAQLGIAAASLVATGLGSDAGIVDLDGTQRAEAEMPVAPSRRRFD
jgi:sugar/nucleoside kinase (ribokinase family)